MNWYLIIFVAIVVIALIVFLIVKNNSDKKEFEDKVNNDYIKPNEKEDEAL